MDPAWNYRADVPGFDVNRDFNPDLDYVPLPEDFPGNSADTGWYITPEAQTVRDVYAGLEDEFGIVDYFVDLHNQWPCYAQEGTGDMSPLSISARFIADPAEFGDWPNFDYDASRRANVAVYDALQAHGESAFGDLTLYPQDTNLPGTALGLVRAARQRHRPVRDLEQHPVRRSEAQRIPRQAGRARGQGADHGGRRRLDRVARSRGVRGDPGAHLPPRRLTHSNVEGRPVRPGRPSTQPAGNHERAPLGGAFRVGGE